jgi:hypothetical protein
MRRHHRASSSRRRRGLGVLVFVESWCQPAISDDALES